jgi:hypothetical protein
MLFLHELSKGSSSGRSVQSRYSGIASGIPRAVDLNHPAEICCRPDAGGGLEFLIEDAPVAGLCTRGGQHREPTQAPADKVTLGTIMIPPAIPGCSMCFKLLARRPPGRLFANRLHLATKNNQFGRRLTEQTNTLRYFPPFNRVYRCRPFHGAKARSALAACDREIPNAPGHALGACCYCRRSSRPRRAGIALAEARNVSP